MRENYSDRNKENNKQKAKQNFKKGCKSFIEIFHEKKSLNKLLVLALELKICQVQLEKLITITILHYKNYYNKRKTLLN